MKSTKKTVQKPSDVDPGLKPVKGWKTSLTEDRKVSAQLLANGQCAIWFIKGKAMTAGVRLSEEASLALLAILDKLLREKLESKIVCNWHDDKWSVAG